MNHAPHPFTLRQLQYVVAVAEERSFRKAAARCHVSQPALSVQVAQVEEGLGVRLFERGPRKVMVTAAGEPLVERARALLLAADDLLALGRASDPLVGTLRLGIIPTIAPYLLPEAAPRLRARWPALSILWREDKTPNLLAALRDGELDGVLLADVPECEGLARALVADDPFLLAVPPGHALAGEGPVPRLALDGADVLLLDDGHCFRDQALEVCSHANAHELSFRATSLSTLAQMVAGGAGVTLLPQLAVATEAQRAHLQVRPFADPAPSRTIILAWRPASPLGDALGALAEALRG